MEDNTFKPLSKDWVKQRLSICCLSIKDERLRKLAFKVVKTPKFFEASGSIRTHHSYMGGLAKHTLEVVDICNEECKTDSSLNRDYLICAAIWHDYGKIWDYKPCEPTKHNPKGFCSTPHYTLVRHLSKSYALFMIAADRMLNSEEKDAIGHLILSHHGKKERGSPVEPYTKEAKVLHKADYESAFGKGIFDQFWQYLMIACWVMMDIPQRSIEVKSY